MIRIRKFHFKAIKVLIFKKHINSIFLLRKMSSKSAKNNDVNLLAEELNDKCKINKNRGTGAGGSNTNHNGLKFEENTNLDDFKEKGFIHLKKNKLYKHFNINTKEIKGAHGCKQPDEAFLSKDTLFIIEKKHQNRAGSVCEKIQTSEFKLWFYKKQFGEKYKIVYIYCLSDWFKNNCKEELEYLKEKNIPVFFGNNINYKTNIIKFMTNYK